MKQFLLTIAGVFVGMLLFAIVTPLLLIAIAVAAARPAPIPGKVVVSLDLRGTLTDQEPSGLAIFAPRGLSVMGIEETLRRAAGDPRVAGLFVRLPDGGMAPAAADELRLAFQGFRGAGKPILAFSQGLYAQGVPTATFELAAASGDVWMQPSAPFQAVGISQQDVFFHDFFGRHGVVPDFQQRYQYKTAINGFLYDDYTPAHRESETSWMSSVLATSLAAAAADRKLGAPQLTKLIEAGPYSAQDAKAAGLLDQVGDLKEAEAAIRKAAGGDAKLMDYADYRARMGPSAQTFGAPVIAVIEAEGDIVTGTASHGNPLGGAATIYSDDVTNAFFRAIEDASVKAIVFRVSSPGGSDTASEEILAAVRAAKAAGKPVVVSMGEYGASGGYWISSEASEIVAEPSTLTGSIGVFGGKFALGPALAKFGVNLRHIDVGGQFASADDTDQPMTPAQTAAASAWIDKIYADFVGVVAEGRKMPVTQVQAIAKGRVWTGAQAKALGLVDDLGGFPVAAARAKALARISGPATLKVFTTPTSPLQAIARLFGGGVESAHALAAAAEAARDPQVQSLAAALHDARARAEGATVLADVARF